MAAQRLTPDRIRQIRERAGLSQRDFAKTFGVDRVTVARWETGRRVPGEWHDFAIRKFEEELEEAEQKQETREFLARIVGAAAVAGVGVLMAKLFGEEPNDSNDEGGSE